MTPELTAALADGAPSHVAAHERPGWPRSARAVEERHAEHGEVAFLLEPNLKEGRGGLRDVHALALGARRRTTCWPAATTRRSREAYDVLLDARVELHRVTGRAWRRPAPCRTRTPWPPGSAIRDADALMAGVERRGPDHRLDQRRGVAPGPGRRRARSARGTAGSAPWRPGVSERRGRGAPRRRRPIPADDPTLAAPRGHRGRPHRLPHRAAPRSTAWPRRRRRGPIRGPPVPATSWCALLLEGHAAIPVLESLDQRGPASSRCCPSGSPSEPPAAQRLPPLHRRPSPVGGGGQRRRAGAPCPPARTCSCWARCCTTWARATRATTPWSAWSSSSASATGWASRRSDVEVLRAARPPHLLLPDVATRRDLSDDATITRCRRRPSAHSACWSCWPRSPRPTRWPPARRRGARGRPSWSRSWSTGCAHVLGGGELSEATWSLFPSASW